MTLPLGQISMSQVNTELQRNSNTTIPLGSAIVRTLAQISPGAPETEISMSDLRGKTNWLNATGGTIVTSGNFRIHIFTSPGTFTVTRLGPGTVEYLVVAGGAGGAGGGGGAGGIRTATGFPVSLQGYSVSIGGGGGGASGSPKGQGGAGGNSSFSTITSTGGGGGGAGSSATVPGPGAPGGSGGGGGWPTATGGAGIAGQGNPGGNGNHPSGQGAGGGGSFGGGPSRSGVNGGRGGGGVRISWMPVSYGEDSGTGYWPRGYGTAPAGRYFAGGGGGGGSTSVDGGDLQNWGGVGGGGGGSFSTNGGGIPGTTNTGGGGGGNAAPSASFNGGSGIVAIRYQYQG
jgi:hypothetical protein